MPVHICKKGASIMAASTFPGALKAHVSLNVTDIDRSVEFYRHMLGLEPIKHYRENSNVHSVLLDDQGQDSEMARTGYAKFDLTSPPLNLVLNEVQAGAGGALSHLGVQVASNEDVLQIKNRLVGAGFDPRDEMQVACCYARQDKTWIADPDGNEWEFFVVLEDLPPATCTTATVGACS